MKQRHEKGSERQIKNKLKERKTGRVRDQRDIRDKREKERDIRE